MPYKDPAIANARRRERHKLYPDLRRSANAVWRESHSEQERARSARTYIKNRDRRLVQEKVWRDANPGYFARNLRRRAITDPVYRLVRSLRGRLQGALRGLNRSAKTTDLLGCTPDQLRAHLEAQFQPGMSWENYGPRGWHMDHIRPCADFDLNQPEQQYQCFHFTNLQPLWWNLNLKKGAKYATSPMVP